MELLERGPVLEHLGVLLEDAREGSGRLVVLRGEAGIGKTSVVKEFSDRHQEDAHVLWGGCDDLLTPQPLGPVWDMTVEEPGLGELLVSEERHRVFQALYKLLARELRPTLMVMEDVHWADESTTDLIRYLGRRIDQTRGLLILTYRDDLEDARHPVLIALGDLPPAAVEQITLEPFTEETVAKIAGSEWDAGELWALTDGNPFFVTEMVETGAAGVPVSIRHAMRSRVLKLSERGRRLVEMVSVVPGRIELDLVAAIMEDAADVIEECERLGVLEVDHDHLAFRHELARQAVEKGLSQMRRRSLSRSVLAAYESRGVDVARCAHFAREARDADAMVRLLPRAARRAAELESHREAVDHLRALEPYLGEMSEEALAELYDLWAWEEYLVENPREDLVERAIGLRKQLADPRALGATLLRASRIAWSNLKRDTATELAEQAVDVLKQVGGENLAMAYSTVSQLAMLGGDAARTIEYGERAMEITSDRSRRVQVHTQNNIGTITLINHYPKGADQVEESFRVAGELDLVHDQARAALNLAMAHLWAYEVEKAVPWLERAEEIAKDNDIITFISFASALAAIEDEMKGDWEQAEVKAREVIEARPVQEHSKTLAMFALARVMVRKGASRAKQSALQAWEQARQSGELLRVEPAGAVLGEYLWLGGSLGDTVLNELAEVADRVVGSGTGWFAGDAAIWLSLNGLIDRVPDSVAQPYQWLDRGDWKPAAEYWRERRIPYEQAIALYLGDQSARLEALEILDLLGAVPLATRLRNELRDAGVQRIPRGPHQQTRDNPFGLTSRQAEVLGLLLENLTNAEIAERLYVSTRTIDHHVSAILTKMGVDDRHQAAQRAREARRVD